MRRNAARLRRLRPLALLFILLSLASLGRPERLWLWKLSVVTKEFGHWFALIGVVLVWRLARGRRRLWMIATAIATLIFIGPTWDALSLEETWKKGLRDGLKSARDVPSLISISTLFVGWSDPGVKPESFVYSETGGERLSIDFYRSPVAGPRPWVLILHGGGWDSGDAHQLPRINEILAARGYSVASIDYRLAPRFQWPAAHEDVKAAIAYLKGHAAELNLDLNRFFLMGRSAGAQIAGVAAYASGDPGLRGTILLYGPTDMPFGYDIGEEDDILASRGLVRAYMGGSPFEKPEAYADASVIEHLRDHPKPTLLFHGKPDSLVWFKHSERLAARLTHLGVPNAFIRYSWAPHGFDYNLAGPAGQVMMNSVLFFLQEESR